MCVENYLYIKGQIGKDGKARVKKDQRIKDIISISWCNHKDEPMQVFNNLFPFFPPEIQNIFSRKQKFKNQKCKIVVLRFEFQYDFCI